MTGRCKFGETWNYNYPTRDGGSHSRDQATQTNITDPNCSQGEFRGQQGNSDHHYHAGVLRLDITTTMQELCDLVKFCRVQQRQHVNSTQQSAASASSWSLSRVVAKALKTLEESDLQNIQDFEPVQTTSTLHIMTKQRHNPSQALMMTLERRTEEISGECNS